MANLLGIRERFWSKVKILGLDDCWEWQGSFRKGTGYGQFYADNKNNLTHRISFLLTKGPILGNLMVMHKCDNRKCCNPRHLVLGDALDNARDMVGKGRNRHGPGGHKSCGEKSGTSKLTESQVLEIRKSCSTVASVAEKYGINPSTVSKIRNGKRWAHVL